MATVRDNVDAAVSDVVTNVITGKKWYTSKTLWANVVAAVALAVQIKYGFIVPAEYQALGMAAINGILRQVTKEAITW